MTSEYDADNLVWSEHQAGLLRCRRDSMQALRLAFRARWRLNRHRRGFLRLQRQLFHRRLRQWNAARVVRDLEGEP